MTDPAARTLACRETGSTTEVAPSADTTTRSRRHDNEIALARQRDRAGGLAATLCTQLVDVEEDVEEEVNGLVTYDRRFVTADEGVVRAINDRLRAAAAASDD